MSTVHVAPAAPAAPTTLGSGLNKAFIYVRGGQQRVAEVPGVTRVQWGRILDDLSACEVTAVVHGNHSAECCDLLPYIHTWQHELVVFRDGARVFEGPIHRKAQRGNTWTFTAWDVLGWTQRRVHKGHAGGPFYVINTADAMVRAAFSEADPNVLAHLTTLGANTGGAVVRDVQARSGYYFDDLDALADQGINFTTVGRRIILWPEHLTLGRTDVLVPERHLVAESEFIEDGMLLSTRAWAKGDAPEPVADEETFPVEGYSGGVDSFYGLVETLTSAPGVVDQTGINWVAQAQRNATFPAPDQLVIPDGSTLNCDAPFAMEQLVPGVVVPVATLTGCQKRNETMILSGVVVTQGADAEQVQITLSPVGGAGS